MPKRKLLHSAADFLPASRDLTALHEAAAHCRGCELYKHARQTVFGEGTARAALMFVGELPGDKEDLAGHPFVGPAGRVLDKALEAAGIRRGNVYVTNAVKHFKRRIHKKPNTLEIAACRPWLAAEISATKPQLIVCLGATAAQSLLGTEIPADTASRGNNPRTGIAAAQRHHPSLGDLARGYG